MVLLFGHLICRHWYWFSLLSVILKLVKTREELCEPPLNLTRDLSSLVKDGKYAIADMDDVHISMEPNKSICQKKHVFIITSAPNNKHLRDTGSDDLIVIVNILIILLQWGQSWVRKLVSSSFLLLHLNTNCLWWKMKTYCRKKMSPLMIFCKETLLTAIPTFHTKS